MKKLLLTLTSVSMIAISTITSYAGAWAQVDSEWYYYEDDGTLATGIEEIDGTMYCFDSSGKMYHDRYFEGYWFGSDGKYDPNHIPTIQSGTYVIDQNTFVTNGEKSAPASWLIDNVDDLRSYFCYSEKTDSIFFDDVIYRKNEKMGTYVYRKDEDTGYEISILDDTSFLFSVWKRGEGRFATAKMIKKFY